ncbi:MAG TPA: TIGR00645 family protein [Rhizomicrobium sp.]
MAFKQVLESRFEGLLFASRWLMAPFYLGLVLALVALMCTFVQAIVEQFPHLFSTSETGIVVWVLSLIDMSLAGNLLLMVIFSGYENFVSKMDDHPDRPVWMGKIDFSGMKLKLIASIIAISAIELLKVFMAISTFSTRDLMWLVAIHLTFVVSGVLLALMDWITERGEIPHSRQ